MRGRWRPPTPRGVVLAEVDEVEVTVEKLVAGGDGLARIAGVPLFVPRSAPGDRLRVRVVERHPDYGRAEIVALLEEGAGRREPPCPHFRHCGGCDLQHLDDDLQVRLKAAAVRETLERLGGVALAVPEVVRGAPWGYRLRAQLHVEGDPPAVAVGYRARRSRTLVPIAACPILVPELEALAVDLAELLPAGAPRRIDMAAGDGGRLTVAPLVEGLPHGPVSLRVGEFEYRFDARCFFQAHRGLLPLLVERVTGQWTGAGAFDLYAGVGLFSLPLARRYGRVVAVEGDRIAARYARNNARQNRLLHVEVSATAVESWIPRLPEGADRVVVDPPRAGLGSGVRKALLERRPRRLTYVSCHAAALARDLAVLDPAFAVESLSMFDLFPQTGHLEVVAQLVARD